MLRDCKFNVHIARRSGRQLPPLINQKGSRAARTRGSGSLRADLSFHVLSLQPATDQTCFLARTESSR